MAQRLFTPQELEEMGKRTVDLVQQAVDQGDAGRAKGLARRMYKEFLAMHDLYCNWTTGLLSFVGKRYGNDALYEALKESITSWLAPVTDSFAQQDLHRQVEMLAAGLRGHLQPLRIEEDDEKVTFYMDPCGSGGRLVSNGAYGPPRDFLKVKGATPWTYDREDFPVYCAHCPFQEIVPIELVGKPWIVTVPAQRLGEEPCRIHFYKDPQAVPAQVYQRAGREKPQA